MSAIKAFWTVAGVAILSMLSATSVRSQQLEGAPTTADTSSLGGIVRSVNGPEAGVWVIAETTDLPTKLAKIVVTDDQGRYLLPELPKALYDVWVRGYGLVDSQKVRSEPGKALDLEAVVAPTDAAAAEYYPAVYWYSMLKVPEKHEFTGSASERAGMPRPCEEPSPVARRGQDERLLWVPRFGRQSDQDHP